MKTGRIYTLVLSLLLIAAGILLIVFPLATMLTFSILLGIVLAIYGALTIIGFLFGRYSSLAVTLNMLLSGIITLVFGIILIANPDIAGHLLAIFMACWMVLMGAIKVLIAYTYKKAQLRQWLSTLIAALLSIAFGLITAFSPLIQFLILDLVIPIYLIALGASNLWSILSDRLSDRARVPLPLWLEAFMPQKVLKNLKQTISTENPESFAPDSLYIDGMPLTTDSIEVFVHLSERSASAFGHVDIGLGDYVLSYGNYDHSKDAISLAGLLYDGVFFVCPRKDYIRFSLRDAGKTIIGYQLELNEQAQRQVVRNTMAFLEDCTPWSPREEDRETNDYSWALKEMGAHLYKVFQGKFKTYFVLNTNCALLSEVLLDGTGVPRSRAFGGVVTPGSAYALYEKELSRPHSLVVSKKAYLNNEMLRELAAENDIG
ncbi:MAG: DUF308 domain-containing protein [Christensenella sp.]|uniref:HdeD family acid-resistance protein n=1 Tax=Christensenella sp. TaxID=1935934 RepID=UPI002B206C0E|nr:DUF308 domain-containing protein [Christensenella sp.]MEA5004628.1 DUF308 domain-containing protein [Christensenella sp.]